jgi:hypothetical protein
VAQEEAPAPEATVPEAVPPVALLASVGPASHHHECCKLQIQANKKHQATKTNIF